MAKKAETELNESNKREAAITSENSVQQVQETFLIVAFRVSMRSRESIFQYVIYF